ncbi:MAG: hypothetical protein CMK92_05885 [Pseudomonas sp.]|nr:hypothetical protein [Pseudomonas sp.]
MDYYINIALTSARFGSVVPNVVRVLRFNYYCSRVFMTSFTYWVCFLNLRAAAARYFESIIAGFVSTRLLMIFNVAVVVFAVIKSYDCPTSYMYVSFKDFTTIMEPMERLQNPTFRRIMFSRNFSPMGSPKLAPDIKVGFRFSRVCFIGEIRNIRNNDGAETRMNLKISRCGLLKAIYLSLCGIRTNLTHPARISCRSD